MAQTNDTKPCTDVQEFEERVEETFDELMDRRRAQLMNSYPRPHGSRNCIKAGLGFMADTAFDSKQWRNSALDRMLDTTTRKEARPMTSETEPLHYHQVLPWVRTQEDVWFTPVIRRHMESFDEGACACEITGWCDLCGYRTITQLENLQGHDRRRLLEIVERHTTFKTKAE